MKDRYQQNSQHDLDRIVTTDDIDDFDEINFDHRAPQGKILNSQRTNRIRNLDRLVLIDGEEYAKRVLTETFLRAEQKYTRESPTQEDTIIEQYLESSAAKRLEYEIREYHQVGMETPEFYGEIVGRMFQDVGYVYYSETFRNTSNTLVSPEDTLEMYSRLNPSMEKTKSIFGMSALSRLSVPDGLILAPTQEGDVAILSTVEYSTDKNLSSIPAKVRSVRYLSSRYPAYYSPNISINFITPEKRVRAERKSQITRENPSITIQEIPVTVQDIFDGAKTLLQRSSGVRI